MSPLARGISFGLGMISAQRAPRDRRRDSEIYADLLDLCGTAEDLGLDAVWLSEHHFVDDGYMPSLLPTAAAIAARTTRIAIGTGVLLAPFYDPLRLAEDAATVDLISAGQPPLTEATRATIRAGALVGTPASVAEGIAAYAAAAGDHRFHFIARLYWPGLDPELMRAALTVHAEQVIPAVRELADRDGGGARR